jgi:7,8-didemethyl-8-hydroxy-5-deazariboflavin synthase CofH subunit
VRAFGSLLEAYFKESDPEIAAALDRVLDRRDLTIDEAVKLFRAKGADLTLLVMVADYLRRKRVGDLVTYVVNRNVNFTNVCVKRCGFCAFSRDHRTEEGYFLPTEEIIRRVKQAREYGATEVCIQAGLAPGVDGGLYARLVRAIKAEVPEIHIHAFSPEEIKYASKRKGVDFKEILLELREAGIGSIPGTAAEILDQGVRDTISPGRIRVSEWVDIVKTAHRLGIPTTATIMYGHIETDEQRVRHIALIRDIQKETGGFTEFVPLSFVHWEAPMYMKKLIDAEYRLPTGADVLRLYAVSRIMLNDYIPNIQVTWVKEGKKFSQIALNAGANDFGGTLMNESISTAAGASNGQLVSPKEFKRMIFDLGRVPAERSTLYRILKVHEENEASDHPLDTVEDVEATFGSYGALVKMNEYRFVNTKFISG